MLLLCLISSREVRKITLYTHNVCVDVASRSSQTFVEGDFYTVFVSVCPLGEELDSHRTVVCKILYWGKR